MKMKHLFNKKDTDKLTLYVIEKGSVTFLINGSSCLFVAPCVICLNNHEKVQLAYSHLLLAKSIRFNPSFLNINMSIEGINSNNYYELVLQ